MKDLLKDPKKRRQILIAGVAAGGLILFLVLRKKSTTTTEAAPETTAEQNTSQASPEGAAAGSGGSSSEGAGLGAFLEQTEQNQLAQTQAFTQAQQSQSEAFGNFLTALAGGTSAQPAETSPAAGHGGTPLSKALATNQEAGNPRKGEAYSVQNLQGGQLHIYAAQDGKAATKIFVPTATASRTPSQPPRVNTVAGNPREGESYKTVKTDGKTEHVYDKAVKGGVGPKKNIVVV